MEELDTKGPEVEELIREGRRLSEKYSDNYDVLMHMHLSLRDVLLTKVHGTEAPVRVNGKLYKSYKDYVEEQNAKSK